MKRTPTQNRALHKYLGDLTNELQAHGIDQKTFLDRLQGYRIPITRDFLKIVWKAVQEGMFTTKSTTELETGQISEVYETINKFTAEEFGITRPFPSMEEIMLKYISEETYNLSNTKEVMGGVQKDN